MPQVDLYDPHADSANAHHEYVVSLPDTLPEPGQHDASVVVVTHDEFKGLGINGLRGLANGHSVIYDLKVMFVKDEADGRL